MKRLFAALLICITFLAGCSDNEGSLNKGLELRNMLLSASGCSFQAAVTADYGDRLYTFCVECVSDKEGKLTFCATAPESISGISGFVSYDRSALTFDDEVLAFPKLTDKEISPVSAPWILINTLKSGYLTACGKTEEIPEEQSEETVMISRTLQFCAKGSSGGCCL